MSKSNTQKHNLTNIDRQPFIVTNNDVLLKLNENKVAKSKNSIQTQYIDQTSSRTDIVPRYGVAVDLKTNKPINIQDKYLQRDQQFKSNSDINSDTNPNPNPNKKFRISRINVDSRYRNKDPKNVIEKFITLSNPFILTPNSNQIRINMPLNHGFNTDDYITITNIIPEKITLRASSLTLKKNSSYLYINHANHGFFGSNNLIRISNIQNANPTDYFIGNIPLSIINSTHNIILIETNGVLDYDNYMIDLKIYSNNDYNYTENSFDIEILTLNGIHIKYINASYPIDNNVLQGYHIVKEVSPRYIKIEVGALANNMDCSKALGNNDIIIGLIKSTISGYPEPDFYKFELKKTYYKVKKIKLVSTEIPNTEMLVKTAPSNLKNNTLYWQIQEDGEYTYSIDIMPGNYDAESLMYELVTRISKVKRRFGSYLDTNLYTEYCIPKIILNPFNNLFSIQIMSHIILEKNVSLINSTYTDGFRRIVLTHPNHNLNIGDQITISNAINVIHDINYDLYIPESVINTTHIVESITGINNYIIKLPKYNPITNHDADKTITDGGNAVNIIFPLNIRLLFDAKDTIGNILGFKNVGYDTSVTPFAKIITNTTPYVNSSNLNSVGLTDTNIPILNFRTYPYILMVSELFSSNINYRDSTGVFAKLFLTGNPGSIIYDQYVQITELLPASVTYLNELEFRFLTPDGVPYNFNGQEHSYTLEIYEEIDDRNL